MKETEKLTEQDIAKIKVKLKPIAGIEPRIYVAVFYSSYCVDLLFCCLYIPESQIQEQPSYLKELLKEQRYISTIDISVILRTRCI